MNTRSHNSNRGVASRRGIRSFVPALATVALVACCLVTTIATGAKGRPPADGGGTGNGSGTTPGSWVAQRLEALAIVDQFPPAVIIQFEELFLAWIAFNAAADGFFPFDEWLWANGIEDPEEYELLYTLYEIVVLMI